MKTTPPAYQQLGLQEEITEKLGQNLQYLAAWDVWIVICFKNYDLVEEVPGVKQDFDCSKSKRIYDITYEN